MERIVERSLLFDVYGDLLTEHQREIYQNLVDNDYSLSEIGEELGISRQGVHDAIKRIDKILIDYEDKLHYAEKYQINMNKIDLIKAEIDSLKDKNVDCTKLLELVESLTEDL